MSKIRYISQLEYDIEYKRYLRSVRRDIPDGLYNSMTESYTVPTHDYWSAYAYGDTVKIIYVKRGKERKPKKPNGYTSQHDDSERFQQSVSRSKARVFELASCNEFRYFCTFTQDEKLRDRFSLSDFRKDFTMLIRNLNRGRSEKIQYLLIPEQHKDGAWHMHGLFKGLDPEKDLRLFSLDEKLPQKIRKSLKNGEKLYDWTAYRRRFGYFTCTEIKSGEGCAKYITKYISKDLQKTVHESGEHLYFASQGLKGRECLVYRETDNCPFIDSSGWDFENDYVAIKEISLSEKADT